MTKQKIDIPADETKAERFRRVSTPRVKRTIKDILMLAKMVKSPAYEISESDYNKLYGALFDALDEISKAYNPTKKDITFEYE